MIHVILQSKNLLNKKDNSEITQQDTPSYQKHFEKTIKTWFSKRDV